MNKEEVSLGTSKGSEGKLGYLVLHSHWGYLVFWSWPHSAGLSNV